MKGLNCILLLVFLICEFNAVAQLTPLHEFDGSGSIGTGARPRGTLLSDGSFLYGLTFEGGGNNEGVLFKVNPDGTGFTKLHDFSASVSGAFPFLSLVTDGTFLYGTTSTGGSSNFGTIFSINKDGTGFTTLHNFDGPNGNGPLGTMVLQGSFLYGTTSLGGANSAGVFFRINTTTLTYTVMHNFGGTVLGDSDGQSAQGNLYYSGNIVYGTCSQGRHFGRRHHI